MQNDRSCQASQQTFEPLALLPRPIQYQRVSFQARCLTPEHKRTVLPTISEYSEGLTSNPSTAPCLFQYKGPGRPSMRSVTKTSAPSAIAVTRSGRRGDVWLSGRTHLNDVELDHQSVRVVKGMYATYFNHIFLFLAQSTRKRPLHTTLIKASIRVFW